MMVVIVLYLFAKYLPSFLSKWLQNLLMKQDFNVVVSNGIANVFLYFRSGDDDGCIASTSHV